MKESHSRALIVAYYLSRFDKSAYESLGSKSSNVAHKEIGRILGVNPNSIKNMRDEFDPLHDNSRVGWYQRPLRPSRAKVVELFQGLVEEELRDVVLEILTNPDFVSSGDLPDIIDSISKREKGRKGKSVFIIRGPTGRKAEEFFIRHHTANNDPAMGELVDKRDHGCGYDFEIQGDKSIIYVEVKGLDGDSGGVVFTSKEWDVARKKGDAYYLAVVRNVSSDPYVQIIRNPSEALNPKKSVFSTVQVSWNVDEAELANK